MEGDLYVPCLNFKPLHVAISEKPRMHVAVGISCSDPNVGLRLEPEKWPMKVYMAMGPVVKNDPP